ncbi:MAG: OadG family protein [Sphaerochaetaceae bacterium]|nr:OadG family protein [Sphaerochaetaceae bacterium]
MFLITQLPAEVLKQQMGNGVVLMLLGMSIVFVFLTILVFTTKGISKIVGKIEAKKPQKAAPVPEAAPVQVTGADSEIAAVIAAAVVKSRE